MSDPEGTTQESLVKEEEEDSVGASLSGTQEGQETKCAVMATSINLQPPSYVSETKTYEE